MTLATKYKSIAKRSFETKLTLYLFELAKTGKLFENIDFTDFKIKQDLIEEYTAVYWQERKAFNNNDKWALNVNQIYYKIKSFKDENKEEISKWEKNYIDVEFPKKWESDDFNSWHTNEMESGRCHYCKISIPELEKLSDKKQIFKKHDRGWTLEIDRLNSNEEYSKKNCVPACYCCNNAKTDEFSEEEFISIGEAIGKVWKQRLEK